MLYGITRFSRCVDRHMGVYLTRRSCTWGTICTLYRPLGTNTHGLGKLLQEGLVMNAVEFLFAVTAVFGSTGMIYAWNRFVYGLDDRYGTHGVNKIPETDVESAQITS